MDWLVSHFGIWLSMKSSPLSRNLHHESNRVLLTTLSREHPGSQLNVGIWKDKDRETMFYLTNGKQTKHAGVIEAPCGPTTIRVTNVARTLLDCAVRAFYGGEPALILRGFRLACEKHDISDLVSEVIQLLAQVNHKYPYHQAIGFYFESACPYLPLQTWQPLRELGLKFRCYLTYRMKEPLFDDNWQIYYPQDLRVI
jgi:hypothetical protein